MESPGSCPACGLPQADGPCPACGLEPDALARTTVGASEARLHAPRPPPPAPLAGELVGGYRLLHCLGQGGMGVVYQALQQSPRRLVALKLIRGAAATDPVSLRLFDREIQALARLSHPGIAAIHEAGCTAAGQHYFAMELVEGISLAEYAGGRAVDATGREELLRVFLRVCEAVAYAHQRAVIHRDLKPSNILVSVERSSEGGASRALGIKVLDFGLARIIDPELSVSTAVTEAGHVRGTPAYMSPEQVRSSPDQVDVRTDVYALGVILYELLTGRLPYPLPRGPLHEVARAIAEDPPRRATDPSGRRLDADLETVLLKALEKDPARRYPGVPALAGDIERYLARQPILARPPSLAYQLRKVVARHRLAFAALIALLIGLGGFLAVLAAQSSRVARERDRALDAERQARQVTALLVDVFETSDPTSGGSALTAREILASGADRVSRELDADPAVQAALLETLGRIHGRIGLYDQSRVLLERSRAERERRFGPRSAEVASSLCALAESTVDWRTQERWARECLVMRLERLPERSPEVAEAQHLLGDALTESPEARGEAEALLRRSLALRLDLLGRDDLAVADSLHGLGVLLYWGRGNVQEARPLLEEALTIRRRRLGDTHTKVAESLQALANLHVHRADPDAALGFYAETLEVRRKTLGERHVLYARTLADIATVHASRGQLETSERLLREVVSTIRDSLGTGHLLYVMYLGSLGACRAEQGDLEEGRALFEEELVLLRNGGEGLRAAWRLEMDTLDHLAAIATARGDLAEAECLARETLGVPAPADRNERLPRTLHRLGDLLLAQGRAGEALRAHEDCVRQARVVQADLRREGVPALRMALVDSTLGMCLVHLGRKAEAEPLLAGSTDHLRRFRGEAHASTRQAVEHLALARSSPEVR